MINQLLQETPTNMVIQVYLKDVNKNISMVFSFAFCYTTFVGEVKWKIQ